jgi:predicted TIM-barrel fold metal-dependent hydrolase
MRSLVDDLRKVSATIMHGGPKASRERHEARGKLLPRARVHRLLDRGNVWVKLSGADRISKEGPPYRDAVRFARALADYAPERVVWGTDWPHPNHTAVPNDGTLVDLIAEIAPDERTRHRMLVENPAKLFGFV